MPIVENIISTTFMPKPKLKRVEPLVGQNITLQEKAYRQIRHLIETGGIEPDERIVERRLADLLKVSRMPIREALLKLKSEGLIVSLPNGSYSVKQYGIDEIIEIFEVRSAIESYAARKVALNCSTFELEYLVSVHKRFAEASKFYGITEVHDTEYLKKQKVNLDLEFHEAILKLSGNKDFLKIANIFNSKMVSGATEKVLIFNTGKCSLTEDIALENKLTLEIHQQIVDAIVSRNAQDAHDRMQMHMETVLVNLREFKRQHSI